MYFAYLITIIVAAVVGIGLGSAVRFNNLGSSGVGIFGTVIAFAVSAALIPVGGALTWVGLALAGLVFGVIFRGAAR